jgi:hypothetical protein
VAPKSGRVLAWFFTSNATPKQSSVVQKDSKLAQKIARWHVTCY